MKKAFVSLRPGDFSYNCWYEIILLNPSECNPIIVSNKRWFSKKKHDFYVSYKAYFPTQADATGSSKKVFDIVFNKNHLERALREQPLYLRQNLNGQPIQFEFKKVKNAVQIRNLKQL